jgi:hypothetical protein
MARFEWNGDKILAKMTAAAELGVDKVMSDCVDQARSDHAAYPPASAPGEPYANRTDFATQSIRMGQAEIDPATMRVAGHWGGYAHYMLFLEIGTSRKDSGMPTATVREEEGGGNMDAIPGPSEPPLMAARPTLRPAADRNYPNLARFIGEAFRGEELI